MTYFESLAQGAFESEGVGVDKEKSRHSDFFFYQGGGPASVVKVGCAETTWPRELLEFWTPKSTRHH